MGYGTIIKEVYLNRVLKNQFDIKLNENKELIKMFEDELKALAIYSHPTIFNPEFNDFESITDFMPRKINEILSELQTLYIENNLIELAKVSETKDDE
jgi:hypothetical protein